MSKHSLQGFVSNDLDPLARELIDFSRRVQSPTLAQLERAYRALEARLAGKATFPASPPAGSACSESQDPSLFGTTATRPMPYGACHSFPSVEPREAKRIEHRCDRRRFSAKYCRFRGGGQ